MIEEGSLNNGIESHKRLLSLEGNYYIVTIVYDFECDIQTVTTSELLI